MSKKDITLHQKYGLNPMIEKCEICGAETGCIVLLGSRIKGEAPMKGSLRGSVCDTCKEHIKIGIILIEVRDGESGENPYRTGRQWVVTEDAITRMFDPQSAEQALKSRVAYIEEGAAKLLGLEKLKPTRGHVDMGAKKDER